MSKGVTRDMQVRAQEQLDKQTKVVDRLKTKVSALEMELREKRVELSNEEGILKYYQGHPALRDSQEMDAQDALWEAADLESSIQDRVELNK